MRSIIFYTQNVYSSYVRYSKIKRIFISIDINLVPT